MKELLNIVCIIIASCLINFSALSQDKKSASELRKLAGEHFENKEFQKAKEYYSQLTTFYPKDPFYNYRFGACMLKVDNDKKFPLKFLEYAVSRPDVDAEAFFYLGRGYHLNYRFREAISYYTKFKEKGSSKSIKDLDPDRQIIMCESGLKLLTNISEPKVFVKNKLSESNFYLKYKFPDLGIKYLILPKELRSPYDNKVDFEPLMYRRNNSDTILFASYGPNKDNGKDIYMVILREDGSNSDKIRLPSTINTPLDEDFPFLHPNGVDLYFASKGHNSMGGYDIFKSTFNPSSGGWTEPENLDYALNTPDNDFLYAVNEAAGYAYFASDRNNDYGNVSVFKIDPERKPFSVALLTGVFSAENTSSAIITVEDIETKEEIGRFNSDKNDGSYLMRLKNGGKYRFLVEPVGSPTVYSGEVELPELKKLRPLKQEMQIVKEGDKERLVIKNKFDEEMTEADELLMAEELLKNADIGKDAPSEEDDFVDIDKTNVAIVSELEGKAKALREESAILLDRSIVGYELVDTKKQLIQADLAEVNSIEAEIAADANNPENIKKYEKLAIVKKNARVHTNEAAVALELAQEMDSLATKKEQEAQLLETKLDAINAAIASDDRKTVVANYQETTEIRPTNNRGSDLALAALRTKAEDLRNVAEESHRRAEELYLDEAGIDEEIAQYQNTVNQTRDKQLKASLEQEIEDLELEKEKNKTEAKLEMERAKELEIEARKYEKRLAVAREIYNAINSTLKPTLPMASVDKPELENDVNGFLDKTDPYDSLIAYNSNVINSIPTEDQVMSGLPLTDPVVDASDLVVDTNPSVEVTDDTNSLPNLPDPVVENEPILIGGVDFDPNESTYTTEYTNQLDGLSSIEEPTEKISTEKEIQEDWLSSINTEIDQLQTALNNKPDAENKAEVNAKLDKLLVDAEARKTRINELDQELQLAQNESPTTETEGTPDLPANDTEFASIADLNTKYSTELTEVQSIADEKEKLNKSNDINQDFLNDIQVEKDGLLEEQRVLSSDDEQYQELAYEIAALDELAAEKQKEIDDNNIKISELEGSELADASEVDPSTSSNEADPSTINTEENTFEGNITEEQSQTDQGATIEQDSGKVDSNKFDSEELQELLADAKYQQDYQNLLDESAQIKHPVEKAESERNIYNGLLNSIETEIKSLEKARDDTQDNEAAIQIESKIALLSEQKQDVKTKAVAKQKEIRSLNKQIDNGELVLNDDGSIQDATAQIEPDQNQNDNDPTSSDPSTSTAQTDPIDIASNEELLAIAQPAKTEYKSSLTGFETENQNQGERVKAEEKKLADLKTDLVLAGKKKEKKAIQLQIDEQERKLARVKAEAKLTYEKSDKLKAAEQHALTHPDQELHSVDYAKYTSSKSDEAELLLSDVKDLEQQLNETKKKKERAALEEQITRYKDSASFAQFEAKMATETLAEMQQIEQKAIQEGSDFSRKLVVVVPEYEANLSEEEIRNVETSQEYKDYKKEKDQYKRRIEQATVLYESADKKEAEAKRMLEEADEIIANAQNLPDQERKQEIERARVMKEDTRVLLSAAASERDKANTISREAYYGMNMANKQLVSLENKQLRDHIIAHTHNLENKQDQLADAGTPPVSADADQPTNNPSIDSDSSENNNGTSTTPPQRKDPNDTRTVDTTPERITADNVDVIPVKLTKPIFIKPAQQVPVYSAEKPIPVNTKMPDGVVFKVQVGAFRNPIPQETFKGFAPITGETTSSGLMRYTAGLFNEFGKANGAKNEIRAMGYNDAFVVAYIDGQRISIARARRILSGEEPLPTGSSAVAINQTSGGQQGGNQTNASGQLPIANVDVNQVSDGQSPKVKSISDLPELFYTVQVGVYSKAVPASALFNITPLNSDQTSNGYIRYSSGVFNSVQSATVAKNRIVNIGIKDAFVTAYYKGKRITNAEAARLIAEGAGSGSGNNSASNGTDNTSGNSGANNGNGTSNGTQEGITYSVQIGPYEGEIPVDQAGIMLDMSKYGVELRREGDGVNDGGATFYIITNDGTRIKKGVVTYYSIGKCNTTEEANKILQECIDGGLESPKIIKFKDGQLID